MMPTLAQNTTSDIWEGHVPENIPSVLYRPKSQYRDACRVCEQGAFADLTSNAASIGVFGGLNTATVCATSAATSNSTSLAATSTGSLQLCYHLQLDYTRLRSTRIWKTGRHTPHVTLLDERSECGVKVCWAVIGKETEFVTEAYKGYRGEGAWLC